MGIVTRLFDSIEGIYWFPIISLVLFVILFGLMTIHALTMKKSKEEECSMLPFENDENFESRKV